MRNIKFKNLKYDITKVFCVLGLFFLTGCKVGPNFEPPDTNMPQLWAGSAASQAIESPNKVLVQWWTQFNDPNLTSLIQRAIKSNLDLKQAQARIRQARATLGVVDAGFWPSVDASASRSRTRAVQGTKTNLLTTGLDAAWEIDIFGGVRRSIESAQADVEAAFYDYHDVMVTLLSEVAVNYVQLRGFQQEIIISQNNLKTQQQSAEIVRKRFEGGFVSALDVANAEAQVATTLSQIPVLETSAKQAIYNISVLLGQHPANLLEELSPPSSIPLTPPEVPIGLPSEILRRRPDIRRAEAQIHSATAKIGVATADFFPKFNLAGSLSISALGSQSLKWDNRTWSFGPSASWEIFSAGRVSANIEVQKSLQQQSLLAYQQTVLTAIQDVENALVAYVKEKQRNKFLNDAVIANRRAVELSTKLYTEGQIEFLNLLDAQRSLYNSEDALVQSNRNLITYLIALYKALGGGWSPDDYDQIALN